MSGRSAIRCGWIVLGLVVVLALGAGCGEPADEVPLPDRPMPAKPDKARSASDQAAPAEDDLTVESAGKVLREKTVKEVYDPINLIDPFAAVAPPEEDDRGEAPGPLKYEIRFYKLVATATGMEEPLAMFEDPEGKSFALRVGDSIGREKGTITRIDDPSVQITTFQFDWRGDAKPVVYDVLLDPKTDASRKK